MDKEKLTFAMTYRMRFIDFLLAQYGLVNRSAIVSYFGLSAQQASNDLAMYQELAPQNMVYDLTAKAYLRARQFAPLYP
jgi:hypothetical protein